jgi:hypothetical protein
MQLGDNRRGSLVNRSGGTIDNSISSPVSRKATPHEHASGGANDDIEMQTKKSLSIRNRKLSFASMKVSIFGTVVNIICVIFAERRFGRNYSDAAELANVHKDGDL